MLRTHRTGTGQILFTLIGRIETEDVKRFQEMLALEKDRQHLTFDLKDVTLVNEDAVKFLCRCEAEGIKLENCPLHIRRWVDQVKDRPKRRRKSQS